MGHEKDEVRKMSRLAIITARGGSKRIPKKNIREFCGKPILAYSIEAALESGLFDHVMVSTDSEEIAEIARKYGAEVPFFRSETTSGDFATTNDVLAEVLEEYEKRGMHFDVACCIYPTAPFVTAEKLKTAVAQQTVAACSTQKIADHSSSAWRSVSVPPVLCIADNMDSCQIPENVSLFRDVILPQTKASVSSHRTDTRTG